ncbi:hypothetical protein [Bosea sp. (in: a-proteobacteria)]|jgi:hypothetical protein|uniref:hypothetical protein n=1 Tax=Bosea sp. (in: a-proteobacteria) TaxID=1871050 RepID=UPI00086A6769|nr:hypothetical protein [Bosea sp. (in: a-proteobacteria)]MBN9439497.1 hypothetical protein [Bosea sp. (in: a-proteobacteria)]ODT54701.1 MAG: hypothetical protein ABS59_05865 [Methylobacterium sp. SCN 67-24]
MAAVFFEVEIDSASGALLLKPVPGAAPSPVADELGKRFRALFDRIRVRVPPTPGRAIYLSGLLDEVKAALEGGDLDRGNAAYEAFSQADLHIRYFKTFIDDNGDLHVSAPPWLENPVPPDVRVFLDRLENACRKVGLLVKGEAARKHHFAALESHAKHGLEEGQISNAMLALGHFEAEFVAEEGPAIRKRHLIATLRTALWVVVGVILLKSLLPHAVQLLAAYLPGLAVANSFMATVMFLAIGVCLGVVFFAFVRNLTLSFDSLGNFDAAHLSPWLRFTLVGVITALLCILMSAGLLRPEINDLKLYEYRSDVYAALLVGILCGYSDTTITQLLTGVLDRKLSP